MLTLRKPIRFAVLALLMIVCGTAYADEYKVDFTSLSVTRTTNGFTVSGGDFDFTALKNSGSTAPTQNSSSKDIRIYAKGTLQVESENTMTKMVFTISTAGKKRLAEITASTGDVTIDKTNYIVTWESTTGATDVTFTVGDKATYGTDGSSKAGQFDINSVAITYSASGTTETVCAKPSFSPVSGTTFDESLTVTATTSTESANIVYNTDNGETFSDFPSEGLTLTETTTIYAKSVDPEGTLTESSVVSATYTKVTALDGIKALRDQIESDASSTAKEYIVKLTNAVVTKVGSTYANSTTNNVGFLEEDGTGIYLYFTHGFSEGDVLSGTLTVSGMVYQKNPEITAMSGYTKTSGTAPEPTEVTIAQLNDDFDTYGYRYVVIKNVPVTTAITSSNRNSSVTVDDASITVRSANTGVTMDADQTLDIKGVAIKYNTTLQYMLYSSEDYSLSSTGVEAPTFSPEGGTYTETQTVYLTSATEGAVIVYTTDGTDPDLSSSDKYEIYDATTGIKVEENMTIKAMAVGDNNTTSQIASQTYTIVSFSGDGSFEKPYLASDIKLMKTLGSYATSDVWVMGYIVGSCANGTAKQLATTDVDTNIALSDDANSTTDYIPVELPMNNKTTYLRDLTGVASNPSLKGELIYIYGTPKDYMNVAGVKGTSKVYGLNSIEIKTAEGYGTYYTNCAFELPEGLTGGVVTAVENGKLTIDYRYVGGDEDKMLVPANTALILKGEKKNYGDIVNTNSSSAAPTDNKLKGSVAEETTTGGDVYYMLSYESTAHESLGFYWGVAEGAAFTNGAHKAYLALTTTEANNAKGFAFEDSTTGINQTLTNAATNGAVYTIDGRRVENGSNLKSGLYIVNGHKVIVK